MIEEIGGRRVKPGDSFSAAYIVGYFDSIDEMNEVYDKYAGHVGLEADAEHLRGRVSHDRQPGDDPDQEKI